ncbi:MAG: MFS transporter [Proteobacteria bacterium]|nr:MFS transporter [Pseudomonadota bacterium]MBU1584532.1 MFS transporter [Pseudomonadota bacterium]MBU2452063.1 MFS transporter [Pseudomonadota bacterium]MBU2629470.1 MFS transporter [Pseudomonadota bacterium]
MNRSSSGILFLLSVSVGVAMIGLGIIWPLIPVYAVELGAGGFLVGLIIASFNVSRVLFSPFMGRLSDRWGRKKFIVAGLFVYAAISIFYVIPDTAEMLIIIRFFHGLASVLVVPIAMALAADIAPKQKLGLYMGTLNMAVMIGLGIGPALGGTIRDHFGMDATFYTMGALAFFTCILVMVFIPPDAQRHGANGNKSRFSIKKMFTHRVVLGIFIMRFFAASGQGAVYTFLPILALQLKLTSSQVGIILTANIFLIAFLQRSCGRLADRVNPKYLVIIGTFASGMTVFGMPFVDGFMMILLLNIFMGMANGISLPGGLVITGLLGRTMGMASLMSITDAAWSLGMIVSPILSGIILDVFGLSYIFIIGSLLILTGGIAVTFFLWNYKPDQVF